MSAALKAEPAPASRKLLRARQHLDNFRAARQPEAADGLLDYFEGTVLKLDGKPMEAEEKFRAAVEKDAGRPEPFLRLAECLGERGDFQEEERILRQGLEMGPVHVRRLWSRWIRAALGNCEMDPAEALRIADRLVAGWPSAGGRGKPPDFLEDARWLLERWISKEPIRINCGGWDFKRGGAFWSRDRFHLGGQVTWLPKMEKAGLSSEDAAIYRTERYFPEPGRTLRAYSIPLPRGKYLVTLHFTEGWFEEASRRRFDVLLENEPRLIDYEPLEAGFGVPDIYPSEVEVNDGALDLDFVRRLEHPKISAIEIERL